MKNIRNAIFCLFFLIFVVLTACSPQEDEQGAKKKLSIAISKITTHPALDAVEQGFVDSLNAYAANNDLSISYKRENANGDIAISGTIANNFKQERVDLALGISTPSAQSLVHAFSTQGTKPTPVLFAAVSDPVDAGLVSSLSGGSSYVTGASDMVAVDEHIALLASSFGAKKIGYIYSSDQSNSMLIAELVAKACETRGIAFYPVSIVGTTEAGAAAAGLVNKIDALYLAGDNNVMSALPVIAKAMNDAGIPTLNADPAPVREGAEILISFGIDYYKMGAKTAEMAIRILEGEKPADIPVYMAQDPDALELIVHAELAEHIGIELPAELLARATEIIGASSEQKHTSTQGQ